MGNYSCQNPEDGTGFESRKLNVPTTSISLDAFASKALSPLKGTSGYALVFDGVDDMMTDDLSFASGMQSGFTIEVVFKTLGFVGHSMALASLGSLSLHWTKVGGLGAHLDGMKPLSTFRSYDDGAWHTLVVSVTQLPVETNYPSVEAGKIQVTLSVDGGEVTTALYDHVDIVDSGQFLLGASSCLIAHYENHATYFSGLVDSVLITTSDGDAEFKSYTFKEAYGSVASDTGILSGSPQWIFSNAPEGSNQVTVL